MRRQSGDQIEVENPQSGSVGPVSGVDYPDGFFYGEFNHEGVITAPDGTTFSYPDEQQLAFEYYDQLQQDKSDEEKKEAEDEKKKQEEEARKKQEEEDAQKQAEEDAAAAEQAQAEDESDAPDTTVPVSTAGATRRTTPRCRPASRWM